MKSRFSGSLVALIVLTGSIATSAARAGEPLDPTFGNKGVDFPGLAEGAVFGLAQRSDGRLISAGASHFRLVLGRYLPDGSPDPSFAGGVVTRDFGSETRALAVSALPNSKILAAGSTWPGTFLLVRYEDDGGLDPSFGERGRVRTPVGWRGEARDLAVLPNGRILAAGYGRSVSKRWTAIVAAYRPDGDFAPGFGRGGIVDFNTEGRRTIRFDALEVLPDGRIFLVGDVDGRLLLVRLRPDGRLDPSFNRDGIAYLDGDGSAFCRCTFATGLALDRKGRAVVSANLIGPRSERAGIFRYLPSGRLDESFGNQGGVRTRYGSRLAGRDLVLQHDGKLILAGAYNVPETGEARIAVVRYRPDGALDKGFGRRGLFTRDFGYEGVAYAALVQRNGRVVVAGRVNREPPPGNEIYDTAEGFLMRFMP